MPSAWVILGLRIAKAVMVGANSVEGSESALKGDSKRDLALKFAQDAMGICSEALPMTPEIKSALEAYNDAYVKLQNVIAKSKG